AGTDKPGFVTFGPYIPLTSGSYQIAIEYSSGAPEGQPVGKWDVINGNGTVSVDGLLAGTSGLVKTVYASFVVSGRTASRYEFRTQWNGISDMRIIQIRLKDL